MAIIAIVISCEDHGPAIFVQQRVGVNKRIFNLYKFRTMQMDSPHDVPTHLLQNPEKYILRSGSVLRKFSLDELPQLFNVLKGDMSMIGPRPALFNQYDLISARDEYGINDIRPGLTGLAQINGRDALDIDTKVDFDRKYAEALKAGGRRAFSMDAYCFFHTFIKVIKHEGVIEGIAEESEETVCK